MQTGIGITAAMLLWCGAALAQTTPATPPPSNPAASPTFTPLPAAPPPRFPSAFRAPPPSAADAVRRFANAKYYIEQYQQVEDYGRCAAHVGPMLSRRVLAADPNSADERASLVNLYAIGRACLPYGYAAPVIFIRGGLAEALYRRTPAAETLHLRGTTAARLGAFLTAEQARSRARLVDDRDYATLANCLAVRAPAPVRAVLMSRHGSDAERVALDATFTAAPACAGMTRFPPTGGRPFLRSYLAESAYRWATFPQDDQPGRQDG